MSRGKGGLWLKEESPLTCTEAGGGSGSKLGWSRKYTRGRDQRWGTHSRCSWCPSRADLRVIRRRGLHLCALATSRQSRGARHLAFARLGMRVHAYLHVSACVSAHVCARSKRGCVIQCRSQDEYKR